VYWYFEDYKINENIGKDVDVAILTSTVSLTGMNNPAFNALSGHLVLDMTKTKFGKMDEFQENYNIIYSTDDSRVLGSLYVVTYYQQVKSDEFKTQLSSVGGSILSTGVFSKFNNGTAIIEYDNVSGKRCLTLFEKQ
jgi:hypothetical protein